MKKVLEDELMSLAHRILKLRNRDDIHELKEEAAVLYEKLSVLSFAEKHFEGLKPTIKKYDIEKSIEKEFLKEQQGLNYPDGTQYNEDQISEHNTEKIKDIVSQMPYESKQVDDMFDNKTERKPSSDSQNNFQDFGVHFDDLPDFEPASSEKNNKPEENDLEDTETNKEESKKQNSTNQNDKESHDKSKPQRKMDLFSQGKKSLNDSLNNKLKIGLNDRLSFVNQLFKGDTEAYEGFINHINTMESLKEAKTFLNHQIKDKYSYWKDKEDIANRLLNLIEKKFE